MIFFVCCILGLCAFSLGAGGVLFKEQFVRKQNKDSLEPNKLKNALDTLESPSSEKTSQSKGDLKGIQSSTKFDKVATHVQDKKIMIPLLREKLQWMEEQKNGLYLLTGSSSQTVTTPHTGTLRISTLKMYPMSLYESKESNGTVSIKSLFDNPEALKDGCISDLTIDDLIFAICRGGWPRCFINKTARAKLAIAKDLFWQTCNVDISNIDGISRNALWAETILKSYARNVCATAEKKTIEADVQSACDVSTVTINDYINALKKLYIIEDIDAWCPAIRSKTAIRSSVKRNLIDPSLAVAALGITPEYFNTDFKTLGFLFESLVIRDLKIYSSASNGRISYYRDRYGLEADCVLHLEDGRYALIEIKLGAKEIDDGAKHLLEIERLIKEKNETEKQCPIPLPTLKMVVTGTQYGYKREDGVLVVPIGCLKD